MTLLLTAFSRPWVLYASFAFRNVVPDCSCKSPSANSPSCDCGCSFPSEMTHATRSFRRQRRRPMRRESPVARGRNHASWCSFPRLHAHSGLHGTIFRRVTHYGKLASAVPTRLHFPVITDLPGVEARMGKHCGVTRER